MCRHAGLDASGLVATDFIPTTIGLYGAYQEGTPEEIQLTH
jgi:hypothetical protein